MTVLAWHFTGTTLRDGRPIPRVGETLRQTGKLKLCRVGLHGSERLIDALAYAPGNMLHRTKHGGEILRGDDKLCSSERTIWWSIDATTILQSFARQCALDVIHLWDAPGVVRAYLETGNEKIRAAAWDAWATTRDAAGDAAGDAARDAALAAWAAVEAAAKSAGAAWNPWAAARAAAKSARTAAKSAGAAAQSAGDAAWAGAGDAAWAATWATARDDDWAAAIDAQNARLTKMVMAAAPKGAV